MHRRLLLGALLCSLAFAQTMKVGEPVGDFTVTDLSGHPATFSSLRGDVTVVMFISTKCPISNAYNDRMKALYTEYAARGVKFIFLNPNENEPVAEVQQHAQEHAFPFAVYKDEGNLVASAFGAQVTPESYVIDKSGIIRYHGHIDDSRNPDRIQTRGLRLALDAVLSGGTVSDTQTKAFGCTIKRVKKAS